MGSTGLFDATEENYPVGNQIVSNYIHEVVSTAGTHSLTSCC